MGLEQVWSRLKKDRVLRLGAVVALAALLPYLLPVLSAERRADYALRFSDIPLILLVLLACQWGRSDLKDRRERRFWDLWSAGLVCWLLVKLADAFGPESLASHRYYELGRTLGFLGLYLFAVLALRTAPEREGPAGPDSDSSVLESAAFVVLGFGLFVYLVLIPALLTESTFRTSVPSVLFYVALDGYLIVTLSAQRRASTGAWRPVYGALLLTACLWGMADSTETLSWAGLLDPGVAGTILDVLWLPPFAGLLVAARLRHGAGIDAGAAGVAQPAVSGVPRRRSTLLVQAAFLPALHLTLSRAGVLDPETLAAREGVALAGFVVLGVLAFVYQRRIEGENLARRELDTALEREHRLTDLALKVSSATQLADILRDVVGIAVDLARADAGALVLVSASGEATDAVQLGLPGAEVSWLARNVGVASGVLEQGRPLAIEDYAAHPGAVAELVAQGFHGFLGVPVSSSGGVLGILTLLVREPGKAFSRRDLAAAEAVCRHAAVAIRNTQLVETLQRGLAEQQHLESARESLIRELSAKNEELERFAYAVSHDLKSPLITLRGFLGFLEKDVEAADRERIRDDIGRIQEAARRMQRLVDELLELSRIGRRANPPETLPFDEIAREAATLVMGRLGERGVRLDVEPGLPHVHGDRPRLVSVVQNLLDNAAKFMGDQPQPRIEVGVRRGGTEPVFFVRDNGIGIAAPFQEKVFSLFEKLDSDSEGTGVGLALVRRVIEVHGGRIWIESAGAGQGTTFAFTLPFVRADAGTASGRGRRS